MSGCVLIRFCRTCGFGVPAEQIAKALRQELGIRVECQPGYWGCFRVEFDGIEVFNRWKTRRWLGRLGFGRTHSTILHAVLNEMFPERSVFGRLIVDEQEARWIIRKEADHGMVAD